MKIGITGPIASGKSIVTSFLSHCLGFPIIDADKIGHKLIKNNEIKERLINNFGRDIIKNGEVDRKLLGKIVFNKKQHLNTLNKIFYPSMRKELILQLNNHESALLEMAILHQYKLEHYLDVILFVEANKNVRIERLKNKGLTKYEAINRIKSQNIKIKSGDIIVENNFSKITDFEKYLMEFCQLLN